jgi:hypothetical protein
MAPTNELLDDGFDALSDLLADGPALRLDRRDEVWQVRAPSAVGNLIVEPKLRFTPRTLDQLTLSFSATRLREMGDPMVLVLAPWLSARSRAAISERGWNYLDLTGNVLLRSPEPAIYVRTSGADTDPGPRPRGEVRLRGSQINALVRLLVDVEPPYRLSDLVDASGLSKGYVSRALSTLFAQKLIERAGSGPVTEVDWVGLLRSRASEYNLFTSNRSASFLARTGPQALLARLADDPDAIVTGSFATAKINQIAAPAQLAIYVPSIRDFQRTYGLSPTSSRSNVLLLEASSPSQLWRPRTLDGIRYVGYSQLVLDLLSGNGRLPEEAEAILEWMIDTPGWRLPVLPPETD